jgi:asparagine synthase (glutamine-hydrolysing)
MRPSSGRCATIGDGRNRRLFLARDRFGKKPLYHAHLDHASYFGGELKCLLAARAPPN